MFGWFFLILNIVFFIIFCFISNFQKYVTVVNSNVADRSDFKCRRERGSFKFMLGRGMFLNVGDRGNFKCR